MERSIDFAREFSPANWPCRPVKDVFVPAGQIRDAPLGMPPSTKRGPDAPGVGRRSLSCLGCHRFP